MGNHRGEYGASRTYVSYADRGHYGANVVGQGTPAEILPPQVAAMASLNKTPILGVPARNYGRDKISPLERRYLENSANSRLGDICNTLGPKRPGSVQVGNTFPLRQFAATSADVIELATRFLDAVAAGVNVTEKGGYGTWVSTGYRVSRSTKSFDNKNVMKNILAGDFSTDEGFSKLGEACVEVMKCKAIAMENVPLNRRPQWTADWVNNTRRRAMNALGDVVIEMDDQGLLLAKPPEEPTVWGGIKHAASETFDWATGVPKRALDLAGTGGKIALIGGAAVLGAMGIYAIAKKSR